MHTVRDIALEIKEIAFGKHSIDIEGYAVELSNRSLLSVDDVKNIYNNMVLIKSSLENPKLNQSKKRIWEKCEDNLLTNYVELSMKELVGDKSKTIAVALKELVGIIPDRTESSIPFRYYHLNDDKKEVKRYKARATKADVKPKMKAISIEASPIKQEKDDLLDMVVDIVDNLDTAGVEVESLFKGILELSKKAVVSSNVPVIKSLEGQVNILEISLGDERDKNSKLREENESLKYDLSKLLDELNELKNWFNNLNGKEKLKQLNNFNQRMKYLVDQSSGLVTAIS